MAAGAFHIERAWSVVSFIRPRRQCGHAVRHGPTYSRRKADVEPFGKRAGRVSSHVDADHYRAWLTRLGSGVSGYGHDDLAQELGCQFKMGQVDKRMVVEVLV